MSCNKREFHSSAIAQAQAGKMSKLNGYPMRHYKCQRCLWWHLTSQDWSGQSPRVAYWRGGDGWVQTDSRHGVFMMKRDGTEWRVHVPGGTVAGPFPSYTQARRWAERLIQKDADQWMLDDQICAMIRAG